MDFTQIIVVLALTGAFIGLGVLAYVFLAGSGRGGAGVAGGMRGLLGAGRHVSSSRALALREETDILNVEAIKARTSAKGKKRQDDLGSKLFRAGFFAARDKRRFAQFRVIAFIFSALFFPLAMHYLLGRMPLTIIGGVLGAFIGFALPMSWLEKQIRKREEDIMYYLPLVIEQVAIGVSSALDVGPCIAHIVKMAGERDSHNAVTEMFVHVEKLIRSGLNLEDALVEVGELNGVTEVKHAFMFLAQCAKHGGEVTRQLQELADAVSTTRQVQVEGKITALPVKATGPLAMVFAGFFALLFAGIVVRLMGAFGG